MLGIVAHYPSMLPLALIKTPSKPTQGRKGLFGYYVTVSQGAKWEPEPWRDTAPPHFPWLD